MGPLPPSAGSDAAICRSRHLITACRTCSWTNFGESYSNTSTSPMSVTNSVAVLIPRSRRQCRGCSRPAQIEQHGIRGTTTFHAVRRGWQAGRSNPNRGGGAGLAEPLRARNQPLHRLDACLDDAEAAPVTTPGTASKHFRLSRRCKPGCAHASYRAVHTLLESNHPRLGQ